MINGIRTPELIKLPLAEDFKRKKTDRALFAPGKLTAGGKIAQIKHHGSAHLIALMKAAVWILKIHIYRKILKFNWFTTQILVKP